MEMTDPTTAGGVVVTYHPDAAALENLTHMVAECGRLIIVDNGSSPETQQQLAKVAGGELIAFADNRGVAEALNTGARRAMIQGIQWLVTFDQDSRPVAGMVAALLATAQREPGAAVVAPRILEQGGTGPAYRWVRRNPRWPGLFQRVYCEANDLPAVTMAVTSGSLVELAQWQELGGFDEAMFIDYVDVDYCLKVLRSGRSIAVSAEARLLHELGARRSREWWGHDFRPTNHAAFRHYYMARNRVRIWRRHAVAVPHWAIFDFCFASYNALRIVLLESHKRAKVKALILGMWDGLRGRSGCCPVGRWQVFQSPDSK